MLMARIAAIASRLSTVWSVTCVIKRSAELRAMCSGMTTPYELAISRSRTSESVAVTILDLGLTTARAPRDPSWSSESDACQEVLVDSGASRSSFCVRTVSHIPRNPGQTPGFRGTRRCTSLLREVVDGNCVGGCCCALLRVKRSDFQARSIDHSDISPFKINDLRAVESRIA